MWDSTHKLLEMIDRIKCLFLWYVAQFGIHCDEQWLNTWSKVIHHHPTRDKEKLLNCDLHTVLLSVVTWDLQDYGFGILLSPIKVVKIVREEGLQGGSESGEDTCCGSLTAWIHLQSPQRNVKSLESCPLALHMHGMTCAPACTYIQTHTHTHTSIIVIMTNIFLNRRLFQRRNQEQ